MEGMCDFKWYRLKFSGCMYEVVKTFDSITAAACHGVSDFFLQTSAIIEFCVAKKNCWETSRNIFALFIEVLYSKDAPVGTGWKELQLLKPKKQEFYVSLHWIFPVTALSSEILQCSDVIICKQRHIMFQLLILSLPVSRRNVGHIVCDFQGVCEMVSWEPHSWTQYQEKTIFYPRCCHILKAMERLLILDSYNRWNLGLSFWPGDKKAIQGMTSSSICLKENISKDFQWARLWSLSYGTEGVILVDVIPGGETFSPDIHQDVGKNSESDSTQYVLTWIQQKSCPSITEQGLTSVNTWEVIREFVGQCYPIHCTTLFGAMEDAPHREYVWG